MRGLFYECSSLEFLPDISKWNINSNLNLNIFINEHSSLKYYSNINDFKIYLVNWIR